MLSQDNYHISYTALFSLQEIPRMKKKKTLEKVDDLFTGDVYVCIRGTLRPFFSQLSNNLGDRSLWKETRLFKATMKRMEESQSPNSAPGGF